MNEPRKWVNVANLQLTESAAKLTGASDQASEVIPYSEYLKFEAELLEMRDIRERFAGASVKYVAEELKTKEFGLELRRRKDVITELRKDVRFYKIGFIFFLIMSWIDIFLRVWDHGH